MTIWVGENLVELRRRYDLDESYDKIAAGMGVSRGSVAGIVQRLNFPPRDLRFRPRAGYSPRRPAAKPVRTLPHYVIVRLPPPPPKHVMTRREIEADFANIWANTARLPVPPEQSHQPVRRRREKTPAHESVLDAPS